MFLSSLFVVLGLSIAQPIPSVPVETTTLVTATRHTFTHQENDYILDLNDDDQIVAFYINNNLQNSHLNTLFEYNAKSENDLFTLFINKKQRTVTGRSYTGARDSYYYTPPRQVGIDYFSNDYRCYQRKKYLDSSGFSSRYYYGDVIEINPLSGHCPEIHSDVLYYRRNPQLYYNTDNGYQTMAETDENYSWCNWWVCYWYLDEAYLTSGKWIEQKYLGNILLEAGLWTMVSEENLYRIFQNMGFRNFEKASKLIEKSFQKIIINKVIEAGIKKLITKITTKKVLWSIPVIGAFIDALWTAIDFGIYIHNMNELKELFQSSEFGQGWVIYESYSDYIDVSPRVF